MRYQWTSENYEDIKDKVIVLHYARLRMQYLYVHSNQVFLHIQYRLILWYIDILSTLLKPYFMLGRFIFRKRGKLLPGLQPGIIPYPFYHIRELL